MLRFSMLAKRMLADFGPVSVAFQAPFAMGDAVAGEDKGKEGEKPKISLAGLSSVWEADAEIREHLRGEKAVLFPQNLTETVKTACHKHIRAYLTPLLLKMAEMEGHPQPSVEPLREELKMLYQRMSKQVDDGQIVHDSWMTRKFLGLIKMKTRIKKPSWVLWQHIFV